MFEQNNAQNVGLLVFYIIYDVAENVGLSLLSHTGIQNNIELRGL